MGLEILFICALIIGIIVLLYLNQDKKKAEMRRLNEKYERDLDGPF